MTPAQFGWQRYVISATVFLACALLWDESPVQAQTAAGDEAWRWVHFTTESGLPSNRVQHVVETAGVVWAGTASGVAWFDGYRWIPVAESGGLPAVGVSSMVATPQWGVLVVANQRLYRGDTAGFRTVPIARGGAALRVERAAPWTDDALLIRAADSVFVFESGRLEPLTSAPRLHHPRYTRFWSSQGDLWLNARQGLYQWTRGRWVLRLPAANTCGTSRCW